jgi:hypothetical protein
MFCDHVLLLGIRVSFALLSTKVITCSHQYNLPDKRVAEEIKGQTFSKHSFVPRNVSHIDKLLYSRSLHQSVRESVVDLLRCTGVGDVTVHLDNFTFLPLCDTSFQIRTGNLVFGLVLGGVPLVNFASHRKESGLLRPDIWFPVDDSEMRHLGCCLSQVFV